MANSLARLSLNECKLQFYEMRQYWFETVFGLLFFSGLFLALFFGIKIFIPDDQNTLSLDGLMMGYVLFAFCSGAFNAVPETLGSYTQKGFLEQLYMTPSGFTSFLIARVLATLFVTLLSTIVLAYFAMAVSGNWIDLNLFVLVPLLFLMSPSIIGIGMIIGGMTLVYKRVGIVANLAMLGIIALVSIPALPPNLASLLPLAPGAHLARIAVLEQQSVPLTYFLIVMLNSVFYLALGMVIYKQFEKMAKRKNLVGQY
ncbi:MAG: hypothetical protein GKR91_09010 [Pseudomonadales bacterium]|nr:hypothetical protein [Pseudomonadales bacterium]